jgi:tripartite-type tricarboxylate transporter receptor subunit TctC
VKIVLPFTAGGAPDVATRIIAQKLGEKWGQPVVVENRPGANTFIGTTAVTKADPDGYTLLVTADQTFVLNPLLYAKLPYDMKELDPVLFMVSVPHMLAISNKIPASNVQEFIEFAKRQPNPLFYGSNGNTTIQRLTMEYFAGLTGIKLSPVSYRGAFEIVNAVLAQEIDATINGMSMILPHVDGSKLKVLAITTPERNDLAPGIPTMQEAGVPGYSSRGAFGLFAPAGTPSNIKNKIAKDIGEILKQPDVIKALAKNSFVVNNEGPEEFSKMIAAETAKWAEVVKRLEIKPE